MNGIACLVCAGRILINNVTGFLFVYISLMFQDGRLPTPGPPEDYVYEELLTRTSWCNAEYAYREIERVGDHINCLTTFVVPVEPIYDHGEGMSIPI